MSTFEKARKVHIQPLYQSNSLRQSRDEILQPRPPRDSSILNQLSQDFQNIQADCLCEMNADKCSDFRATSFLKSFWSL